MNCGENWGRGRSSEGVRCGKIRLKITGRLTGDLRCFVIQRLARFAQLAVFEEPLFIFTQLQLGLAGRAVLLDGYVRLASWAFPVVAEFTPENPALGAALLTDAEASRRRNDAADIL